MAKMRECTPIAIAFDELGQASISKKKGKKKKRKKRKKEEGEKRKRSGGGKKEEKRRKDGDCRFAIELENCLKS